MLQLLLLELGGQLLVLLELHIVAVGSLWIAPTVLVVIFVLVLLTLMIVVVILLLLLLVLLILISQEFFLLRVLVGLDLALMLLQIELVLLHELLLHLMLFLHRQVAPCGVARVRVLTLILILILTARLVLVLWRRLLMLVRLLQLLLLSKQGVADTVRPERRFRACATLRGRRHGRRRHHAVVFAVQLSLGAIDQR
jgi:hypothetical protein